MKLGVVRAVSLQAVFESSDVERFRLDFAEGLGGEPEELVLLLPVMRQVFAQPQKPGRGERDGMPARKKSANDAGSEIGEPNQRSKAELVHSDAGTHCLDAIVRA
jgi:hypothetical protein